MTQQPISPPASLSIIVLMPVPILDYSSGHGAAAARHERRQMQLWGVLGAMVSFLARGMSAPFWLRAPFAPLTVIAILGLLSCLCRLRMGSWIFGIGAFWGGLSATLLVALSTGFH